MEFTAEASKRKRPAIKKPFVVGAAIDLGNCLDLTTSDGVRAVREAYKSFVAANRFGGLELPRNSEDRLRRNLDCAVIRRLHSIMDRLRIPMIDTVKCIFTEGKPIYPGAGFLEKTHFQICVCNPVCIKGVFRVPARRMSRWKWRLFR